MHMCSYQLNKVMYDLTRRADKTRVVKNMIRFMADYELSDAEKYALTVPNFALIRDLGGLTNLVFRYYQCYGLSVADFANRLAADRAQLMTDAEGNG